MPCYDPPYDLEQMSASAVQPYVETLAEIDRYCDDMLRELDLHPNKPTDSPQAVGLGKMMAITIKDIVHKRFRPSSTDPHVNKVYLALADASQGTVEPTRAMDIARRAVAEACDNREGK